MDLKLSKFRVTGLFPLLTHNPAQMRRADGAATKKKIPSEENEAKAGLYLGEKGNFCLPSMGFRSALLSGLKNKKVGKVSAISIFQAAVFTVDELTVLVNPKTGDPLKDYKIDTRRAIIQRQGILRSRPRFEKWGCTLFLQIDEDITTPKQVEENLNIAGQVIGIGDFRIEKRGMFGKFKVELMK
jgi:hypothetical protein